MADELIDIVILCIDIVIDIVLDIVILCKFVIG